MKKGIIAMTAMYLLLCTVLIGCAKQVTKTLASGPLKIGVNAFPTYFLWYVAEEKGFFDKRGVQVKLEWFPTYSHGLSALSSGNLDANSQTLSDTLAPVSKGIKLQIPFIMDHSNGADGFIAKPEFSSIKELKGKKIATELGTVDHFFMLTALQKYGLKEKDIQFVNMSINDAGPAFIAGNFDAAVLWEPFLSTALASGKGKLLFSSKEMPGLLMDAIVFREEIVKQRPEDAKKVTAAWVDAVEFLKSNPKEAIAIMAKHAEITEDEFKTALDGVKVYDLNDNLNASKDQEAYTSIKYNEQKVGEFLKSLDYIATVPDVSKVYDPRIVQQLANEKK